MYYLFDFHKMIYAFLQINLVTFYCACDVCFLEQHLPFCPQPNAVFFLDIPPEQGLKRVQESRGDIPDAFERLDTLQRCATIFRGFTFPFVRRFDGTLPPEDLHELIAQEVLSLLDNSTHSKGD